MQGPKKVENYVGAVERVRITELYANVQSVLLGVNRVSHSHINICYPPTPANSTPSKWKVPDDRVCTGRPENFRLLPARQC
jgi:hypothetical protein